MDFERLARQNKDAIYRQMVRMCGNADDAEDVLAESLLKAWRSLGSLHDEAAFRGWLAIIARRTCGRLKARESLLPLLRLADLSETGKEPADPGASPETRLLEEETKACLLQALADLPPIYRAVYELRDLENLPASAVADRLEISVAAVKSRLHRARALVRRSLDEGLGTSG